MLKYFLIILSALLLTSCSSSEGRLRLTLDAGGSDATVYVDGAYSDVIRGDGERSVTIAADSGMHRVEVVQWGSVVYQDSLKVSARDRNERRILGWGVGGVLLAAGAAITGSLYPGFIGFILPPILLPSDQVSAYTIPAMETAPARKSYAPHWIELRYPSDGPKVEYVNGRNMIQVSEFCFDQERNTVWIRTVDTGKEYSYRAQEVALCERDGDKIMCGDKIAEKWIDFPCGSAKPIDNP